MFRTTSISLGSRRPLAAAVLILAVCLTAACSSSKSTAASGSSAASSTAASSGGASNSTSAEVAAAQALVAKYEQAPTKIDFTTPLKSKPPTGKTIVQVTCQVPQCQQIGAGAVEAATALGWTAKVITYSDQNTSTLIAAMDQALQYNPIMVGITAVPQTVVATELPKYAQAGVPIDFEFTSPVTINKTVVTNPGGHVTNVANGTMLGEWVIQDSHASANVLGVGIPALPTTQEAVTSAQAAVAKGCTACKFTLFNATLAEVGNNSLVPAIVSALQKDPSIKYVISGQAGFTSTLPAALKAAGITGIKLIGAAATIPDEQQIQTGQAFAMAPLAFTYEGWQLADSAARYLEGMPVPDGETSGVNPVQLITKDNVGTGTPTGSLEQPVDYRNQFKQLWLVS